MPFNEDDTSTLTRIRGKASNEAGQGLQNVAVKITSPDDPNFLQEVVPTDNDGKYPFTKVPAQQNYDMQVSFLNLEGTAKLRGVELKRDLEVDLGFNVVGLDPDQTYADAVKLDVSKPFYPFGQQPQPGAAFYFSQEEVFSKPGAQVQIYVAKTVWPQDAVTLGEGRTTLSHTIHWEYWNGRRWVTMFESENTDAPSKDEAPPRDQMPSKDLNTTKIIELRVPPDLTRTSVNEQDGLWMRARLVSGGFGFTQNVTFNRNTLTYVITQPPALAAFRIGYAWRYGPFHPEHTRTYNDFQYEDHTYEAIWPGVTFFPFSYVRDVTPALYLGFDKRLPVDRLGIYLAGC
jgi:hypothetical protein